jgi:hypothetical protein
MVPTVAILDNHSCFLSLVHGLFIGAGFRTLRCRPRDVREMRALVKFARPSLVLSPHAPGADDGGWVSLKRLWGDVHTTHIPVILAVGNLVIPREKLLFCAMRCAVWWRSYKGDRLLPLVDSFLRPVLGRQWWAVAAPDYASMEEIHV